MCCYGIPWRPGVLWITLKHPCTGFTLIHHSLEFAFPTILFCRVTTGFVTSCECSVWCHLLPVCLSNWKKSIWNKLVCKLLCFIFTSWISVKLTYTPCTSCTGSLLFLMHVWLVNASSTMWFNRDSVFVVLILVFSGFSYIIRCCCTDTH